MRLIAPRPLDLKRTAWRAREEESREKEGDLPDRNEYYLESLISDAFKGKGFQKINEIIQEKDIYPPQKYSKQLLNQLDKVLKKELDKNEFPNVSLLLKCIQQYCRSDPQEGVNLLLQQGLIAKMVTWFERTRDFLSLIEPKESKFLVNLVEDFFDTALIIGKSNTEGKKQLLESFIPYLGHLATDNNVNCAVRQEALRTLNTLLNNVAREERKKFALSEEMCLLTKELAKAILDVGDYDIQVAIVEALFRLMLKKWRDDLVHNWFEDQHLAKAFREIKDREFETDSRKFLNELNERLGDDRRVCSIPCKAAHADMNKLKKPPDDKLEEFWIDFNFGSESITFYLESPEGALWESARLTKEDVSSYYLTEEGGEKVLKMLMKNPTVINKKEVTKIKIHFDSQFDVSTPLFKVMGKDKMMITFDKDNYYSGNQPPQNASASSHLESGKDLAGADSLLDILTSQLSDQSVTTTSPTITPADPTAAIESQPTEEQHGSQASSDVVALSLTNAVKTPAPLNTLKASPLRPKDNTAEPTTEGDSDVQSREELPLVDDALEKTNARKSSTKHSIETNKDAYEFEHSSDPVAHEMVSEMKQKVFVQKATSHRSSSKRNLDLSKSERRLSTSYKNHLFSESNQETPSNSASEKSWILDSQKKSTPKTADYTRKRLRVKSNLKVLPLSSPSSGSDRHTKKVESSAKAKRRLKPSTEMRSSTTVQPVRVSSTPLSHIRQSGMEMVDATLPLSSNFSPDNSDAGVNKEYEAASSTLALEDEVSRSKRKLSDFTAGFDRKRSKLTERSPSDEQSPSIPFVPRKLFNSVETEKESHRGESSDELEDDVFVSKILEEGIGDSGVIAAFENFTSELKKTFWSRYKRMEIYTQNILRAPEQNISALFNRIHQRRLNELEHFQTIVVQELAALEKRIQFLASLEKDTVEFWTKQSNKLNSKLNTFCIHQMQRIQSMDSELDETTKNHDVLQNVAFGKAVDHEEERSKVFVIASD
ncbi:synaptonemal complex protein 2-like isoform X2 [Rhineura floridana]|uniref:synaptonemal complex protein 2-like isoform X2 n=1 Tax=Rhineura floridana TaxID=261503 RepID=UPI002AC88D7A|nr:synaptonemal complex protein 2-like isoform X2 [Rhineura floridana]